MSENARKSLRPPPGLEPPKAIPEPYGLSLLVLGHHVRISTSDTVIARVLSENFGAMSTKHPCVPADLEYEVARVGTRYVVSGERGPLAEADGLAELLYFVEKALTVALQRQRQDLFFLHAAAVELQGRALLLVAASGSGKSTTTWGLLHHGFGYLSDELGPVELDSMCVLPYPHALCLKRRPPHYALPDTALDLGRTIHVPALSLPARIVAAPTRLAAVLLVQYSPDRSTPLLSSVGAGEAAARIYANTLNALAHSNLGLDGAARLAQAIPCFAIEAAGLRETCALIRTSMAEWIDRHG